MASEDNMLTEHPLSDDESRISITELSLPKRARNALLRAGIRTLEEAIEWSDRDLLSLPHIGRASVASLRAHIGRMAESPQA
jgi:DNA-directed RNA polymerase alpha subunit